MTLSVGLNGTEKRTVGIQMGFTRKRAVDPLKHLVKPNFIPEQNPKEDISWSSN